MSIRVSIQEKRDRRCFVVREKVDIKSISESRLVEATSDGKHNERKCTQGRLLGDTIDQRLQ